VKKKLQEQCVSWRVIGFLASGGISMILDVIIFWILIEASVPARTASLSAISVALLVNFGLNYLLFATGFSAQSVLRSLAKFSVVAVASSVYLLVSFDVVLGLLGNMDDEGMVVTRILIIASATLLRFLFYRAWVFRVQEL